MTAPELSSSLNLSREDFSSRRSSIDWFAKFVAAKDDVLVSTLAQMSRMDLDRPQLINLAAAALRTVEKFEHGNIESANPNAVVECARLFYRVYENSEVLEQAQIRQGTPLSQDISFYKVLIKLQQADCTQQALILLEHIANSRQECGTGLPKIDRRGI